MILYFSATGNTKYIASELAKALNDSIIDLREKIREKDYTPIHSKKPFVICSPVYVSEPPRFLMDFLRRTRLTGNPNVYFVFSSGGYSGISAIMGHQLAVKKRMKYKGTADFIMPSNYIAENMFPIQDTQEIEKRILRAQRKIKKTAATIRSGGILKSRYIWLWEYFVTLLFYPVWYHLRQGVKDFHVSSSCISCGKCERLCPLHVISMRSGKPVWKGRTCAHCMSCIQNCPVQAIEYGTITKGKKRYNFKNYSYVFAKEGIKRK